MACYNLCIINSLALRLSNYSPFTAQSKSSASPPWGSFRKMLRDSRLFPPKLSITSLLMWKSVSFLIHLMSQICWHFLLTLVVLVCLAHNHYVDSYRKQSQWLIRKLAHLFLYRRQNDGMTAKGMRRIRQRIIGCSVFSSVLLGDVLADESSRWRGKIPVP